MPKREIIRQIYIDRDIQKPEKGWGWVEVEEQAVQRFNIPHEMPKPRQKRDGRHLNFPSKGRAGRKKFIVNIGGELVTVAAQKSLTVTAVCNWIRGWAPAQAKIVTPGGREMSLDGQSVAKRGVCFVYFIENPDSQAIKIGVAKNVEKRLRSLQTASPAQLSLLRVIQTDSQKAARELEQSLYQRFQHLQLSGEWFQREPELLSYMDTVEGDRDPKV